MSKIDQINSWNKEFATRLARQDYVLGKYQDNALHPEAYLDISAKSTMLNTPIGDRFISFVIPDVTISKNTLDVSGVDVTGQITGFIMEDPIITITRPREIVQTVVNGLDGKIIEIVSNGNYEINIVGTFAGVRFWEYDNDNLVYLEKICKYKGEIDILSPYLNNVFEVFKIIVTDHKIAQSSEFTNITAIELNCVAVLNESIFKTNI
jgi:hypothetical protein